MNAEDGDRSIWNDAEATEEIREKIADILDRDSIRGATIAIVADGHACSFAIGSRDDDPNNTTPLDPGALSPIYSITKMFIASAILRLVESGVMSLEESVHSILPWIPLDPAITLRQVLNHTSGLPDYGGMPAYGEGLRRSPETPWTSAQFLDTTLSRGMLFPPGEGWSYSNIGYLILKLVLEQTTGMSLRDALDHLVITPAGLEHTYVAETLSDMDALTPGFSSQLNADPQDDSLHDISRRYHPGWVSHGLVVSTASDVAVFLDTLMRGRFLSQPLLTQMLEPNSVPYPHRLFANPSYGLGLMLDPGAQFGTIAGHAGGGPGYSTAALHLPDTFGHTLTTVALVNRDYDETGLELALTIAVSLAERVWGSNRDQEED